MSKPHQVAIQLTPEDYVAFSAWYYRSTPKGRRTMRRLYALGVLLFAVFAYSELYDRDHGIMYRDKYLMYMAVSALIFSAAYAFFLWYIRPTLQRLSLRSGVKKQLLDPVSYTFAPEGITLQNEHGTGRLAWTEVQELVRTPRYLFLWLGAASVFILPLNQLSDVNQTEQVIREYHSAARTHSGKMP